MTTYIRLLAVSSSLAAVMLFVISPHAAVGKIRKQWLQQSLSGLGVDMIRALKQQIDPTNVFACGNLLP